jgi:hypothetical protein
LFQFASSFFMSAIDAKPRVEEDMIVSLGTAAAANAGIRQVNVSASRPPIEWSFAKVSFLHQGRA